MCFSATASFSVGTALLPAGAYCMLGARRENPRYWPVAALPVIFGVQQISEGFVWQGMAAGDPAQVHAPAMVYLFTAIALVPFWIPTLSATIERQPARRRLFWAIAALSTLWFWLLYFPLLTGPPSLLTVKQVHHSLEYLYPDLWIYRHLSIPAVNVLYFATMAIPMGLCTENVGRRPLLGLAVAALLCAWLYHYAFVSVWCFFAAVLSFYTCLIIRRLQPARMPGPAPGSQGATTESIGHV